MLNFDIQNHRPLREMVYEELKMQILTGAIVPGTRMMEVELAEEMGVSRTPIRERSESLKRKGLLPSSRDAAPMPHRYPRKIWSRSWRCVRTWKVWLLISPLQE